MSNELIGSVTTVLLAIVGVAIIAVIVSKNAATSQVIGAGGSAFAQDLGVAISPVTGATGFGFSGGLNSAL